MVFPIKNPFPEKNNNILFEPSDKLPSALRGTPSLGRGGEKIYVRFENVSEEEQILNHRLGDRYYGGGGGGT